ncbi:MAG: hypothetical protein SF123_05690 [Chloroflexota bacterium]|nr:hypothetical protein [Chloroflexota bacterium]
MNWTSLESRMQGQPARPVRGGLGGNGRSDAFRAAILLHKDNPKAANQVVIGLLFVVFASSVTALISFT